MQEYSRRVEPILHGENVLGHQVEGVHSLVTFDLAKNNKRVDYISDEVTAICPVTGQPDWYSVEILLEGTNRGLESKSLKLYLQHYRNVGVFCEHFAHEIADDVFKAVCGDPGDPHGGMTRRGRVAVIVTQKPRGGVSIKAEARRGSV